MTLKSFKSYWSIELFRKSIVGGFLISMGGTVYLSVDNKVLGAFLFSLGLITILVFGMKLFTGVSGHIRWNGKWHGAPCSCGSHKHEHVKHAREEVVIILLGNLIGCKFLGMLLELANPSLIEKADKVLSSRGSRLLEPLTFQSITTNLALGLLCGILMFMAVDGYRKEKVGSIIITIFSVVTFILCGFEHSIADAFYISMSSSTMILSKYLFVFTVIIGNLLGGQLSAFMFRQVEHDKTHSPSHDHPLI